MMVVVIYVSSWSVSVCVCVACVHHNGHDIVCIYSASLLLVVSGCLYGDATWMLRMKNIAILFILFKLVILGTLTLVHMLEYCLHCLLF